MAQTKKFSVIIPLYKDNYKTLERCLLCLREQDYKNFEVIFVHNSPDEDSKKYLQGKEFKKFIKKLNYKEIDAGYKPELKSGNHCRAFNKGTEVATGDYYIFHDPDIYHYPGVFREYAEAFEANPEVDFVYGDYDFEHGTGRISGRKFNSYELRCANYVSGAFPIKKEAFKGWDENIESLQDWDMWLSAIDNGAKGFYIGRPCFTTELPTEDGISANQADNWLERYSQIRAKHGFPVSETVVTSLGAPFHASNTAEIIGADTRVLNNLHIYKPHEYKNIYLIGFYPSTWDKHLRLFYELGDVKKKLTGGKRIIHWVGTDIYQMQHNLSWIAWQNIKNFLNDPEFGFIHLSEAPHTQKELHELGIETEVVPLPPKVELDLHAFPKDFTVGVYINPTQDMYYEEFMYSVADALPDIKFKFFGNPNKVDNVEDNKEWVGWVDDMQEFMNGISALVRLTVHDGLPIGPVQALQAGRNVLASVPLEHALLAEYKDGMPDIEDTVAKIRQMETMGVNTAGSDYWKKEMSHDLFRERIYKILNA